MGKRLRFRDFSFLRSPGRPRKITPSGLLLHLSDFQLISIFTHFGNSTKRYYTWRRCEKCRSGCGAQVPRLDFPLGETQGRRFRARFRFLRFPQNASLEAPCTARRDLGAARNSPKSTVCLYKVGAGRMGVRPNIGETVPWEVSTKSCEINGNL